MTNNQSRPPREKVTLWSAVQSAALRGWGATIRLLVLILLVGAILIGLAMLGAGNTAPMIKEFIQLLTR